MPRKKKETERGVPVPTYADKQNESKSFQDWVTDYQARVAAKNELAKSRREKNA